MKLKEMNNNELNERYIELKQKIEEYKAMNLSLNMARGKPCTQQVSLSDEMMKPEYVGNFKAEDGTELRNYGVLDGIPECKQLFADLLDVPAKNIIIFGNSSLNIMYDCISQYMMFGAGKEPWVKQGNIKFLCPVPGYDRHFGILEAFGIEMINVNMNSDGPDMDFVEEQVKDPSVKGLICVPMYSNPGGITFSDETVKRFASLKPAAEDFRVIWDNAYCVHHLSDNCDKLLNIFKEAEKYGNEDLFIEVASTSKISYPGSGVAALAASDNNIASIKKRMAAQTIGHDKINEYRHVAFFKNAHGIKEQMKKHAAIIKPKFDMVLEILNKELSGKDFASWTEPKGGYFISLDVYPGCAKKTVAMCKDLGVVLTGAGATYPYGKDPEDKNIRIAPTFPSVDELKLAAEILCTCAEFTAIEKLIG